MSTPATSLPHSASVENRGFMEPQASAAWKAELNARLREHRERRAGEAAGSRSSAPSPYPRDSGEDEPASRVSSRVAERVAERYRSAPSYQELLAASAAAAAKAAETAAEAALAAQAVLSSWEAPAHGLPRTEGDGARPRSISADRSVADVFADPFFTEGPRLARNEQDRNEQDRNAQVGRDVLGASHASLGSVAFPVSLLDAPLSVATTVEHHAPLPERTPVPSRTPVADRARALVDAFAEAVVPAAQGLPAKLIEFPRELIAPRKQRPLLAEGPLLDQARAQESSATSLRIFEVVSEEEPDAHKTQHDAQRTGQGVMTEREGREPLHRFTNPSVPTPVDRATDERSRDRNRGQNQEQNQERNPELPRRRRGFGLGEEPAPARKESGWGSIRLGEHPQPEGAPSVSAHPAARRVEHGYKAEAAPALHDLAPVSDRLMGALVDSAIVSACFLLSVLVFASCTTHAPSGKSAIAVGLLVFGVLATFYGWLFMSFGGGSTPGMRYARIALCTFADENPTRKELQNRVPATALALLPLGLGVFWALLDEDQLGWQDRMTRTYQRSYR